MGLPLRVLIVEDSIMDAELLLIALRAGGYEPIYKRVDTPSDMKAALENQDWDIIISDYVMPRFSGLAALKLVQEMEIDLPFIIVTGQVGEETAVETMKAGANDYVLKGNLTRLVPAIQRELRDAEVRRERKRADEALRRAHEELRLAHADLEMRIEERTRELAAERERLLTTLRSIGDGVIATDDQGKVILMNRIAEELTGWKEVEATGLPLPQVFHIINEESRAVCEDPVERVLRTGAIVGLANNTVLVARDGTGRIIADSAAPIRGEDGAIVGVVLVFRDVTERKLAEQERERLLQQVQFEEVRWRTLVESMPDMVTVCDADGHATYVNAAQSRLFGYRVDASLKLDEHPVYYQIYRPDGTLFAAEDLPLQRAALRGEESRDVEVLLRTPEGEERITVWDAAPLRDPDGRTMGAVAVGRDMTDRKRTESELRRSEERFRAIFEAAPLGMALVDAQGRPVETNRALQEMLGYSGDELLGMVFTECTHPEDAALDMSLYQEMLAGKRDHYQIEKRYIRKDGQLMWGRLTVSLLRNSTGEPGLALGMVENVTGRKGAEEERDRLLEEVERRAAELDVVIENTSAMLALFDHDLNFIMANTAYASASGHTPDELIGRNHFALFPNSENEAIFRTVRDTSQSYEAVEKPFEYADQPWRGVTYWNWTLAPIKDQAGGVRGLLLSLVDVTPQVKARREIEEFAAEKEKLMLEAEQRAREAEEGRRTLDALMEYIPEGVTIADAPDVTIRRVSRYGQALAARPREVLEGIPAEEHPEKWELYHADGVTPARGEELPLTRATRWGEIVVDEEWVLRRPDGEMIPTLCNAGPIHDQSGSVIGGIIAWRDARALKSAQRMAERRATDLDAANKELEAFAYSVSHDLRAPLRHIDGFSKILLEAYADKLDDQGKQYLRYLREGGQKMDELIDALLKLSRATRAEMRRQPVNLSDLTQSILAELQREHPERQVELTVAPGASTEGDPQMLRVMLENLLGNAWKFTSRRPVAKIEFGVALRDGKPIHYLKDNGVGFDARYGDKLFAPFQRLHRSEEYTGTGVGLTTVQRIIHRHGGSVWAEGEVDKGATFYFTLGEVK